MEPGYREFVISRRRLRIGCSLIAALTALSWPGLALAGKSNSGPINWVEKGNLAGSYGNLQEALNDYTVAVRLDEKNVAALYNRALVYRKLERTDEALADVNRAIVVNPFFAEGFALRAKIERGMGSVARALSDAATALSLQPASADARLLLARMQDDAGRNDAAAESLQLVLSRQSKNVEALALLARVRSNQGRKTESLDLLKRLEALAPLSEDYVANAALMMIQDGHPNEALSWLSAHGSASSDLIRLASALALHSTGRDRDALSRLGAYSPADTRAILDLRGSILFSLHACREAVLNYAQAAAIAPAEALSFLNLGSAYACAGEAKNGLDAFTTAARIDPSNAVTHRYRADMLRTLGDRKGAILEGREAIRLGNRDGRLLMAVGVDEYLEGQHTVGRADYAQGCKTLPRDDQIGRMNCAKQLPQMRPK